MNIKSLFLAWFKVVVVVVPTVAGNPIAPGENELDEDELAVIDTPAILALVPLAAFGAKVSSKEAISEFESPVVFKEKNKSVEIFPICVVIYAFIDCCVASAVLESEPKSSSSKI